MGVKELKGELPWAHLRGWAVSFQGQVFLIDAANTLFWCALACCPSFSAGDDFLTVAEFRMFSQYLVARKVAMGIFSTGCRTLTRPTRNGGGMRSAAWQWRTSHIIKAF